MSKVQEAEKAKQEARDKLQWICSYIGHQWHALPPVTSRDSADKDVTFSDWCQRCGYISVIQLKPEPDLDAAAARQVWVELCGDLKRSCAENGHVKGDGASASEYFFSWSKHGHMCSRCHTVLDEDPIPGIEDAVAGMSTSALAALLAPCTCSTARLMVAGCARVAGGASCEA